MSIELNFEQKVMLAGERGTAKQMGMRLVLDLASAANADELVSIKSAHLSGVSPLTGGLGLRLFLKKLGEDADAEVSVPTTLNSAGCDMEQFEQMGIVAPDFLAHNREIVEAYTALGVRPTQSCIPYEWEGVVTEGASAWAESNAICFGNSYRGMVTNRESGLSALAAALTGYTPKYGLLEEGASEPNLLVKVTAEMVSPADYSILGDWIGKQRTPDWVTPLGPIPLIEGLPDELLHEEMKALTAAAANYGSPKVELGAGGWGLAEASTDDGASLQDGRMTGDGFQDVLYFTQGELERRYEELAPREAVSLVTIGCPQASVGEIRAVAEALRGKTVRRADAPVDTPMLWVFTSKQNEGIAEKLGLAQVIREAGALLLADTCPEVVPYDRAWVKHILTNSMKAEHYIQSGLNGIPTSVMRLGDCVGVATGELEGQMTDDRRQMTGSQVSKQSVSKKKVKERVVVDGQSSMVDFEGKGLPSQGDFVVEGEAFVTDTPITLLGFVNRETGVIEEEGHPADGESMAGKIAIFPKGSGSTVAPYVLLELFYRGKAPLAIVNTEIDQQCAPACSLEAIPYGYDFGAGVLGRVKSGDRVRLERVGEVVRLSRV